MRKLLVTGAYGFLGRHIAQYFCTAGWNVTGLGHGSWSHDQWKNCGLSGWTAGDITLASLVEHADRPDLILHCAGGSSVLQSIANPDEDFRRTVDATRDVLEYARLYVPEACIVFPSSAAVYGEVGRLPIQETAALAPISPYGFHKRHCEELCRDYATRYGLNVTIVRLFSVYGPGLRKQLLWDACEKLRLGESTFAGTGREQRDWLQVADAVLLLATAAKHASAACPIVNGGSGRAVTVEQVLKRLAPLFPRAAPAKFSGVSRPGDPLGYEADITRARAWGWSPCIGFDQGITDYVRWYLESTALRSVS